MLGFLDALAFLSFRLRNQLGDHCLPILQTHAETLGAAVLGVMVFEATELKDGGFGQVDCVTRPGETGFPGGGRVDDLADVCHEACLEYAGLQHPGTTYRGQKIERVRGVSWKPFLDAITVASTDTSPAPSSIHGEEHVTGWEIAGSGALRKGRYKITYVPLPRGPQRWELFDIVEDPGETRDLSKEKPEIFNELLRLWAIYAEEVGVVGLAGQVSANNQVVEGVKDEFEDTGRWIRFIGKDNVPPEIQARLPK